MIRGVRGDLRLRKAAVLAGITVCAGLASAVHPGNGAAQGDGGTIVALDSAALKRAPAIRTVFEEAGDGPYAATEAGLVDVNCRQSGGSAAGTGIVLSSDGVAVTNAHVVASATSITATDLGDGRRYPVDVLLRDPGRDVAVIRLVGAAGLAVAPLGDSDGLKVGDRVTALGNAGGRGGAPTVTSGSVTALGRSIVSSDEYTHESHRLRGMIEVSASVPAGDSGGALLDSSGVVGMNTAQGPNSGFAIPINTVLAVAHGWKSGAVPDARAMDAPAGVETGEYR